MDQLVQLIWNQLGGKWLAAVLLILGAIRYSNIMSLLLRMRSSSAEQVSIDRDRLNEALQEEIAAIRKRRLEDQEEFEREALRWRERETQLLDMLYEAQKATSRERHIRGALAQHVASQRIIMTRAGIPSPPFDFRQLGIPDNDPDLPVLQGN